MRKMRTSRLLSFISVAVLTPTLTFGAYRHRSTTYFRHGVGLRTVPELEPAPKPAVSTGSVVRDFDLQPAGFTPYDRYLGSVRSVLAHVESRPADLSAACHFLRVAHTFRYVSRDPYRADLPSVTTARQSGDCKAKALWLYDRLGDSSALFVIGKSSNRAKTAHAWLYWHWEDRWWILDPTNQIAPIAADSVGRGRYVPYYSYMRGGAYRHPATHLLNFAQAGSISVVAERNSKR